MLKNSSVLVRGEVEEALMPAISLALKIARQSAAEFFSRVNNDAGETMVIAGSASFSTDSVHRFPKRLDSGELYTVISSFILTSKRPPLPDRVKAFDVNLGFELVTPSPGENLYKVASSIFAVKPYWIGKK